jgi:hypothetical protein
VKIHSIAMMQLLGKKNLLLCALLGFGLASGLRAASGCAVTSASISIECDDYLYFYINGNLVVNGTPFDPHPGVAGSVLTIPPSDFAPAGSPNYFAAEVQNTVAASVGGAWLISITCADGSISYISSSDASYFMHDDPTGSEVIPVDGGGNNWYDPGYTDPGNKFTASPIYATPFSWMNTPQPALTDPLTGITIPLLSANASGNQNGLNERLYFRESIVLPEITPTITPTPYPTVCGASPSFVSSQVLNTSGCTGSGNPTSWTFNVPAGPGEVLVVNVENGGSGTITGVTWNGIAMTQLPSDGAVAITGNGTLYTYYMVNPVPGSFLVAPTGINGCGWNVVATLYQNVDTSSPLGAISTNGGNSTTVTENITTTAGYSIIHDFFAIQSGPSSYTGTYGTQLFAPSSSQCCDNVYGSYSATTAPGLYTNSYVPGSSHDYTGVSLELKPVTSCGTPTYTPVITPTLSFTPSDTFTSTKTLTPSPTKTMTFSPGPSPTATPTKTVTMTFTLGPSPTFTRTITVSPTISPSFSASPTQGPVPQLFKIVAIYPNPVGDQGASFVFNLPYAANVDCKLYDLRGEAVWEGNKSFPAGMGEIPWKAVNNGGAKVSYGAYYLVAKAKGTTQNSSDSDSKWLTVVR